MKKSISIILAVLCLFSLLYLISSADGAEIARLKQEKATYESNSEKYYQANVGTSPYYDAVDIDSYVFLYTDTAAGMEFDFLAEDDFEGFSGYDFLPFSRDAEGNGIKLTCVHNEKLASIFQENPYAPRLYALVKALNVPKDDLKNALVRMNEQPEYVKTVLPSITESEYERFIAGNAFKTAKKGLKPFMIDALYLDDGSSSLQLLCKPWSVIADGKPVMLGWLLWEDPLGDMLKYDFRYEELKKCDLKTEDFQAFLRYCDEWIKSPRETETLHVEEKDAEVFNRRLSELKGLSFTAPAAGERTVILFSAALTAAGALAACAVVFEKKKKRF